MASQEPNSSVTDFMIAELGRRLAEVTVRIETALGNFDKTYVRKDLYDLQVTRTADQITALTNKVEASDKEMLKRISDLEDDKKWLTRLILGFIIMGILGAVFVAARAGGVTPK